jgi:hypothetical protein
MEKFLFDKLDLMIGFLDTQAKLPYSIKERVESQLTLGRSSIGVSDLDNKLVAYDRVLNFSSLAWQEKLDAIGKIILLLSQFVLKLLSEFTKNGVFKIKWYDALKVVSIVVKFINDLKAV